MDKANGKKPIGKFFDELDGIPKKTLLKYWNDAIPKLNPLQEYTGYRWDNLNKQAMENEKYYTPTIEEFHVGFECENRLKSIFTKDEMSWEKFTCSTPNVLYSLLMDLKQNDAETRVKYLDKEDIESFGFVINSKDRYGKNTKDIRSNEDNITHIIHRGLWWILITQGNTEIPFSDWSTRFSGIIKNKSELKILLKQLDILT